MQCRKTTALKMLALNTEMIIPCIDFTNSSIQLHVNHQVYKMEEILTVTVMVFGYLICLPLSFNVNWEDISDMSFQTPQKSFIKNTVHVHQKDLTLFPVFGNVVKHHLSCLMYYFSFAPGSLRMGINWLTKVAIKIQVIQRMYNSINIGWLNWKYIFSPVWTSTFTLLHFFKQKLVSAPVKPSISVLVAQHRNFSANPGSLLVLTITTL